MLCTYITLAERSGIPLLRITEALSAGELVHTGFLVDDSEPANAATLEALRADPVGARSAPAPEKPRSPREPGAPVEPRAQFRPSKKPRATPVIERGKNISKSQGVKHDPSSIA